MKRRAWDRVRRVSATENVTCANDSQKCDRDKYGIGRANHDDISSLNPQTFEAVAEPSHPLEELLRGEILLVGSFAVQPQWLL